MYNICIRIVPIQADAEDIVQESFIKAFNNLDSYKGVSTFGAWLKRIVINTSINHLKKRKQWLVNIDELPIPIEDCSRNDLADEGFLNKISPEMIHKAIKSLPIKARVVFNLYLLEGYLHKEIAEMLDISESTSKSQYQRALKLLQERLKRELG
jgi:RNA polymerase sigma factor, sigma-70 family